MSQQFAIDAVGNPTDVPFTDAIRDLRGPAIVATGSIGNGFKFCGPFETIDAAVQYHQSRTIEGVLGVPASIFLLDKPKAQQ